MTLTMKCDRDGCTSTQDVDYGIVPWQLKWIEVSRKWHFCSFKCAVAYARKQVLGG